MLPMRPNSPTTWMFGVSSLATLKPKSTFVADVEKEFSDVPPNPTADAVRSCALAAAGAMHTARRKDRTVRRYDMDLPRIRLKPDSTAIGRPGDQGGGKSGARAVAG